MKDSHVTKELDRLTTAKSEQVIVPIWKEGIRTNFGRRIDFIVRQMAVRGYRLQSSNKTFFCNDGAWGHLVFERRP